MALGAFTLGAAPAEADEFTPESLRKDLIGTAQQLMESADARGEPALAKTQREDALRLYQAASGIRSTARLLQRIAIAERRLGRWSEAMETAERCMRTAGDDSSDPDAHKTVAECERIVRSLEPGFAVLVIRVEDPIANRTRVLVDGKPIDRENWENARCLGGTVSVEVTTPGRPSVRRTVAVRGGEHVYLSFTQREPRLRNPGFITLGVGLAGLGVGAVLGALAIKQNAASKAHDHCGIDNTCDQTGLLLREDARAKGHGATAAFLAGGALLATGIVLVLTSPSPGGDVEARKVANKARWSARLEVRTAGIGVTGTW